MKKYFLFAVLMAVCTVSAQAQLEVKENGSVKIGDAYTPTTELQIYPSTSVQTGTKLKIQ